MGVLSSLNKERKRTKIHELISDNLFKGANAHKKPKADLEAEYNSMQDYILNGPQEGGRTYSQREITEGPAFTLKNSIGDDRGQVHGSTGEFGWATQREGENAFDDRFYRGLDIPAGSWLANQMKGNTGATPTLNGAPSLGVAGPTPSFGQYTPPPQTGARAPLDFSGGNPFATHAGNIGFSDYQDFKSNTPLPAPVSSVPSINSGYAGVPKGSIQQAAISSALRGGAK